MKTTQELYDCHPSDFVGLGYIDAIKYKLDKAIKLHRKLLKEENEAYQYGSSYDELTMLRKRIKDVGNAIDYNKALMEEMNHG